MARGVELSGGVWWLTGEDDAQVDGFCSGRGGGGRLKDRGSTTKNNNYGVVVG